MVNSRRNMRSSARSDAIVVLLLLIESNFIDIKSSSRKLLYKNVDEIEYLSNYFVRVKLCKYFVNVNVCSNASPRINK